MLILIERLKFKKTGYLGRGGVLNSVVKNNIKMRLANPYPIFFIQYSLTKLCYSIY